jgi:hemoglobin/transferrin/lactoferrin receptor protein
VRKITFWALLSIFLFLISEIILGQKVIVRGKVVDSNSKNPISNVNVIMAENEYLTSTNSDGQFSISLSPGKYSLKISHISYESESILVDLIDNSSDTLLILELQPTKITLNDIYLVSTRIFQRYADTPLPLEVITQNEIQKYQPQTISDLVSEKPGLALQRDGIWATNISIRGLSGPNVIALVNGTRIETATDLDGALSLFDLNNIKQIEIIKNASSVLYGTGALGGIINIITEENNYSNSLKINANATTGFNSVNKGYSNGIAINLSDKTWWLSIDGSYRTASDTKTPSGELTNSGYNDDYYSGDLGIYINENNKLKISYQNFKGWDIGIPGGEGLFPDNASVKYSFIKRDLFDVKYSINNLLRPLKELTIKFYSQNIYRFVDNVQNQTTITQASDGQPNQIVTVDKITPNARHYANNLQLQSNWLFGENLLLAGIDAWQRNLDSRRERIISHSQEDPLTGDITMAFTEYIGEKPLPDCSFRSIGVYSQDEFPIIADELKVTIGARADQIFVKNDSVSSPVYYYTVPSGQKSPPLVILNWPKLSETDYSWSANFNIFYKTTKNVNLTFSYSHSFRAASLEERYKYIDLGGVISIGNPKLKPEQGNYFDTGIRFKKDKLSISGDIFLNYIYNQIIQVPGVFDGRNALLSINAGRSRLYGFDAAAQYHLSVNSSLKLIASFVKGEDLSNGYYLPAIAPFNGRFTYNHLITGLLNFEISISFFASQNEIAPGEIKTPGYTYYNFYINSQPFLVFNSELVLYAGCENFANKSYRNHLSTNRGFIVSEPGRNFFIKINLKL